MVKPGTPSTFEKQSASIVKRLKLIDEAINQSGSQKILDIGCGVGVYEQALSSRGLKIVGIDLEMDSLIQCQKNCKADFCKVYRRQFGFHTLRRTFGRNLWLIGQRLETISELLGHTSTDMTRIYIGLNLSDMSKALACYKIARTCTYTKSLV